MTKFRRAASVLLTGIMAATFAGGTLLAFADTKKAGQLEAEKYDTVSFTDVTGKVDVSGVALQNLSPSVLKNAGYTETSGTKTVIVRLDADSVSESIPDGETVSDYISSYAGSKKIKSIKQGQTNFLNSLSSLGVSYKVRYQYTTVTNAVAIEVDASQISAIKSLSGVKSAYLSKTYAQPEAAASEVVAGTTENYSKVYETGIYDSSEIINDYNYDGSGTTVAILDTGLDYTHEAFTTHMPQTLGLTKADVAQKLNDKEFNAVSLSAANGRNITADDLYVNDKVPFAYDYADSDPDVYPSYSQHGTHVAGIVAGHADSYNDKNGNKIDKEFKGVAPNAQLVICKVFTDDYESHDLGGATTEDIVAALDDCVKLGVDVINMSLGTASGFSSGFMEGDDEGLLLDEVYASVKDAGISLIVAASNEYSSGYGSAFGTNLATNPDSGTVGSPSTFDGAVSVASVNGLQAPFMVANADENYDEPVNYAAPIFYTEASDANSVRFDFAKQLLGDKTSETFKYVVVPNIGDPADYTAAVQRELNDENYRTIALVKRGKTTFETKIKNAMRFGADAVIIYNNVAGSIGMSVGEIENPIPAVSITMEEGAKLIYPATGVRLSTGFLEVNSSYHAGPFMNEYSSWGATPDLKLKPDVTSHGGDIISTVAGGYAEQSGTSMASPNLAGFVALVREYVKNDASLSGIHGGDPQKITQLINQIVMSSATTVYDREGLPYSPRKQGSGLATLKNSFGTKAYLWTDEENGGAEDDRPKIELGELEEDENEKVKFSFSLFVTNFGESDLDFIASSQLFTETLSSDRIAVAEKAYFLNDIAPVWTISENGANPRALGKNEQFTVVAGGYAKITVTLELSDKEKNYITTSFPNGMFVEGFITLKSQTDGQCDLNLPFMGFYGDWESAPMLDYDAYEIAEFKQDTTLDDDTRPKESVWATQAYANYYNNQYAVPMGGFLYTQDENAEQIYANTEYAAISRYNWFYGDDDPTNYLTTYQIKALYAGLLRNAAVVTYDLYDAETGEIIKRDNVYRVGKAYAGGGSSTPAQVLLEFDPDELGLVNNGKYALDFYFYFNQELYKEGAKTEDNTFSMTFYVDYEAPTLVDSRIRYVDHPDTSGKGQDWQSVYLDLDIYDNTYAQAVILCYNDKADINDATELRLVTDYITPVYNPKKNGTTTVSIDITDLMAQYAKYKNRLYLQIDDYALNHRVLKLNFETSTKNTLPSEFEILGGTEITIGVNETYKVGLKYDGNANLSNFTWDTEGERYVKVFNGEIFGVAPTRPNIPAYVTVTGANGVNKTIAVTVVDNGKKLTYPTSLSFGMIENSVESLVKATGTVKMSAGKIFTLDVTAEPWYYNLSDYTIVWRSSNPAVADVDQNGKVTISNQKGTAAIYAEIFDGSILKCSTSVTLAVQDPFTISNYTLTKYSGTQETVKIPDDKNITTIGENAFKDNTSVKKVIIPKTVTSIDVRAFVGCTNLEEVYFIDEEPQEIPDANLTNIRRFAFSGCTSLKKVDLSNCKTITVDRSAFEGCTDLEEIVKMDNIGTMLSRAFYGCTSLMGVDLTGMHVAGSYVFGGCTLLNEVKTGFYTAIGANMFNGCTSLEEITINAKTVEANAFANCASLTTVNFGVPENGEKVSDTYIIGARAFLNCANLTTVNFNGKEVTEIGDMAFADCTSLTSFDVPAGLTRFGDRVFDKSGVTFANAVYSGDTLLIAPKTVPSGFTLQTGTTKIAPYAFSGCNFANGTVSLNGITQIGEGAFANSNLNSVTIPAGVTGIADYAFTGTQLTSITVPANVTKIGAGAFMNCANLATVTFDNGSSLNSIGDAAFYGCTALTTIILPDGVKTMGSSVFYGCTALTTAVMPSVESLGAYTFVGCTNLTTVTFGADAKTVGDYTFGSNIFYSGLISVIGCDKLTTVSIGGNTKYIGEGAFMGCTSLGSIDLKNVTEVANGAFYACTALNPVDLTKLEKIGNMAFYGCTAITELNLHSAKEIGEGAFYLGAYTVLSIPVAESIGNFAFFGGREATVAIPLTLKTVGYGAFANSANLTAFTIAEGESSFKVADGVLYRVLDIVSDEEAGLELTAYPSAKSVAADSDGVKTYAILEGTATVKAYAMAHLADGAVKKVIIPYSVKTLGDAAFLNSGINEYSFEAINAPVLLSEFYYLEGSFTIGGETYYWEEFTKYAMFARNFEFELAYPMILGEINSILKISYPSNGSGYNNYVYENYFGTKAELGELMDDNTRALIKLVTNFPSISEIKGWNSLEVNKDNTEAVEAFSALVISAHELYNILASDYQKELFGEQNEQKLFDTESALKPVKKHFGIPVKVKSFTISGTSTHKTVYTEGEKFSLKGLVLIANYDDYSTELADMSKIILSAADDKELMPHNRNVIVQGTGEYAGVSIRIPITVNEKGNGGNSGGGSNGSGSPSGLVIGLSIAGGVLGFIIIAAVVAVIVLKYKFNIDVIGKIFKKSEKTEVAEADGNTDTNSGDGGDKEE